ncbi:hypothetical protein TruAng_011693 [Truncatella angustata]|nr:hypothetical protein TruAng_011693 [Truncatella angustata]
MSIDFGTTTCEVSYAVLDHNRNSRHVPAADINYITNWPDDPNHLYDFPAAVGVPSEIIYPTTDDSSTIDDSPMIDDFDCSSSADSTWRTEVGSPHHQIARHLRWGYQARGSSDGGTLLKRFKLMLQDDIRTHQVRRDLAPLLSQIGYHDASNAHICAISDYLTCLLRHVKSELIAQDSYKECAFEVVLCIPAIWTPKACREMQTALALAFTHADFDQVTTEQNSINGLFLVSEPEAAAAWVLQTNTSISAGDTFVLVDAGGGTVDVSIYTVSQKVPLRLQAEGITPQGDLCGSSYLNELFFRYIRSRLEGADYLTRRGETLDEIAHTITMTEFELIHKRNFDIFHKSESNKLINHHMKEKVFKPCLQPTWELVQAQIERYRNLAGADKVIDKVVLTGGFAGSISLNRYLERKLWAYSRRVSAVASGGILRSLNKDLGPARFIRSSFGLLRTEPWDDEKEEFKIAGLTKPQRSSTDGGYWVRDTIYWVLKHGSEVVTRSNNKPVEPVWTSEAISCTHTIVATQGPLRCEELLFVSDSDTESYYKRDHSKNHGAEVIGRIITDFTFLRKQGLIRPRQRFDEETGKPVGRKHYEVEYELFLRVVGRDLQCYAKYKDTEIQRCQINIASAFDAGVE